MVHSPLFFRKTVEIEHFTLLACVASVSARVRRESWEVFSSRPNFHAKTSLPEILHLKGGLIETGGLFILKTTMVSLPDKKLEYKVEKQKYKTF